MDLRVARRQLLNCQSKEQEQEVGAAIVEDKGEEELQEASAADPCNHSEELVKDCDEAANKKNDDQEEPRHCELLVYALETQVVKDVE